MDVVRATTVDRFEAYDTSHQVVVLLLLAGAAYLIWRGRSQRDTPAADRFSQRFAVAVALLFPLQLWQLTPDRFDLGRSLPLQLCDLAWFAAVYALWTRKPWAVALTYYWGLTLTTQAVLTPDLAHDFPDLVFLSFWALHLLVVWTPIYLTWGLGVRPTWHTYGTTVAITFAWAVGVFVLNLLLDTNYGYLNEKPANASILDLLGEWPVYVLAESVIVLVVWALLTWPWEGAARRRERRGVAARSSPSPREWRQPVSATGTASATGRPEQSRRSAPAPPRRTRRRRR